LMNLMLPLIVSDLLVLNQRKMQVYCLLSQKMKMLEPMLMEHRNHLLNQMLVQHSLLYHFQMRSPVEQMDVEDYWYQKQTLYWMMLLWLLPHPAVEN